jgi:NAD-dependent DNA ligase
MDMNENIAQEILHELFSSLERLEAQSAAILQFLKDRGIASEQELAPYFEQAGNASSVRWRAAAVRIDHLLSAAIKSTEQQEKKSIHEPAQTKGETSGEKEDQEGQEVSSEGAAEAEVAGDTPGSKPEGEKKDRTSVETGEKAA